jgi:intracellular multiplication protein IcmJ
MRTPSRKGGFPLELGVKRRLSRRNDPQAKKADEEFERIKKQILARDHNTCQSCGFSSPAHKQAPAGFLEVHHIDDDHHHNESKNLITLCPFCHMGFTLGKRGDQFAAKLIWYPEVSQRDLNALFHPVLALNWIRENEENLDVDMDDQAMVYMGRATDVYRLITTAGTTRLKNLGTVLPEIERIETLYDMLVGLSDHEYKQRGVILNGIRLVPRADTFEKQLSYWAQNVWLKNLHPSGWDGLIKQMYSLVA